MYLEKLTIFTNVYWLCFTKKFTNVYYIFYQKKNSIIFYRQENDWFYFNMCMFLWFLVFILQQVSEGVLIAEKP